MCAPAHEYVYITTESTEKEEMNLKGTKGWDRGLEKLEGERKGEQ